jgi:prepilin-type N-terminal cleavage/methylation domain-containing protein
MTDLLKRWQRFCSPKSGFTLVETLIALALLGMISLSIANFLVKSNVTATSVSTRIKEADEVHGLIDDIRQDLLKGAYISPNSYDLRLEYTIPSDLTTGTATKKVYRIITSGSAHYLQLSTDGGTTWGSPYGLSAYTKYDLGRYAKFLYADIDNNCSDLIDTDSNGVYDSMQPTPCMSQPASLAWGAIQSPTEASSVVLRNFRFTTNTGSPTASHPMPYTGTGKEWDNTSMSWVASMSNSDIFLQVNPALVRSEVVPPSPYVKDPQILQSFVTNTANSLYGTDFVVRDIAWDAARKRLIVVGNHWTTYNQIFLADRNGVVISDGTRLGRPTSDPDIQLEGVAVEGNSNIILALDTSASKVYRYNLNSPGALTPLNTVDLNGFTNYLFTAIAYDPNVPDDFFALVRDMSNNSFYSVIEVNKRTGAQVGSLWPVYGGGASEGFSTMFIEPLTGDFIVVGNYVNDWTAPNFAFYRVKRSNGSVSSTTLHIEDTTPDFYFQNGNYIGVDYDPALNRMFLSNDYSGKVYELLPESLITARQ